MIAEQAVERFEDLEDGPVSLGKKDDGKIPQYRYADGRFVMVPMPKEGKGSGLGIAAFSPGGSGGTSTIAGADDFTDTTGPATDGYSIVWDDTTNKFILSEITGGASTIAGATDFTDTTGPGTDEYTINWDNDTGKFVLRAPVVNTNTTTIADATDFTDTTGSGTDGYSVVWDNGTSRFILSEITGGAVGGLDTQVLFNDGGVENGDSGLTYAKATDFLSVTGGVATPIIRPTSDGAAALRVQNSSGATDIITVDTSGSKVLINAEAFIVSTNYTDAAIKNSRISVPNYNNADGEFATLIGATSAGGNFISYGGGSSVYNASTQLNFFTAGNTTTKIGSRRMRIWFDGGIDMLSSYVSSPGAQILRVEGGIGSGDPTMVVDAFVDVAGGTASRSSMRLRAGVAPTTKRDGDIWRLSDAFVMFASDATNNSIVDTLILSRSSSGSPTAGFGSALKSQLKSSTTVERDAGNIKWSWNVSATDATRDSRVDISTFYTTTENTSLSAGSDSSGSLLSFHGATLAAKPDITGSRGGNAALADLLAKLATIGLITDSTT